MKNGKLLATIVGVLMFLTGLAFGTLRAQSSARDMFVEKEQYQKDVDRLERKIDRLLVFHMKASP